MDIKRTILWVIFSMSLVLLYDNWQRANGHASMFFPSANTQQQAAPANGASGAAAQGDVPKANVTNASAPGAAPAAPQALDLVDVQVDAGDLVAQEGQAHTGRQSDVAGTHDTDLHPRNTSRSLCGA